MPVNDAIRRAVNRRSIFVSDYKYSDQLEKLIATRYLETAAAYRMSAYSIGLGDARHFNKEPVNDATAVNRSPIS